MTPHDDDARPLRELAETGRRVSAQGLVVGSSGNISLRLPGGRFAISASGSRLEELTPDRIAICSLDPTGWSEGPRASLETPFHRAVYSVRPDVGAVLHFQSPCATALSCAEDLDLDLAFIPEIPAYIPRIAVVPFLPPGSSDLAEAIADACADPLTRLVVLRNHGQIALERTLARTLRVAEVFEFACRIETLGLPLRRYDRETIEALRAYGESPS